MYWIYIYNNYVYIYILQKHLKYMARVRKIEVTCICRCVYVRAYYCPPEHKSTRTLPINCMRIHPYICIYTYTYVRAYTRTHVHLKSVVHSLTHKHVYRCVHSCMRTRVQLKSSMCAYMRAHADTLTRTHTHT